MKWNIWILIKNIIYLFLRNSLKYKNFKHNIVKFKKINNSKFNKKQIIIQMKFK